MFVGHYAVSLAVKAKKPEIPLWQLFLAVQFVDILFFGLSFFRIERFNLIPDYTASTHFELVYMPYTHSLAATVIWGALTFGLFRIPALNAAKPVALALSLAVMSHWALDFIVHTPDLPLLGGDSVKVGLGLWNYSAATYLLEAVLLGVGAWLMLKAGVSPKARRRVVGFMIALLAVNAANIFGPAGNVSATTLAVAALVAYFAFAGIAYWAADK